MKTKILIVASLFVAVLISIQSCKDDKEEASPEFVASSADFADFRTWTEVATNQGPDPALGAAHKGNDETVTRTVYVKNNQERGADGRFPVGTIVVKDTRDANGNTMEVTAIVKRGNKFDSDHNDWEWFMLMPDGTIGPAMDENGNIMEDQNGDPIPARSERVEMLTNMCGGCHNQAKNKDFIFSK